MKKQIPLMILTCATTLLLSACRPNVAAAADSPNQAVTLTMFAGQSPASTQPPPTELPPTVTPVVRLHPINARTGITIVDAIIEAALDDDVDAMQALVHYTTIACVATVEGLGGPPLCAEGETDGTLVEVLPILGPEGYYVRPLGVKSAFPVSTEGLYGVYWVPDDAWHAEGWPAGTYGIVFIQQEHGFPVTFLTDDQGIVRIDYAFGSPQEMIEQRDNHWLLPPVDGAY